MILHLIDCLPEEARVDGLTQEVLTPCRLLRVEVEEQLCSSREYGLLH